MEVKTIVVILVVAIIAYTIGTAHRNYIDDALLHLCQEDRDAYVKYTAQYRNLTDQCIEALDICEQQKQSLLLQ